jgi:hypothetical protein
MNKRNTAQAYPQNKPAPKDPSAQDKQPGHSEIKPSTIKSAGARFIRVHRGNEPTLVNLTNVSRIFAETVDHEGDVATRILFRGERYEIPMFCDAFFIRESLEEVEALIRESF